jgi:hypothetical protein
VLSRARVIELAEAAGLGNHAEDLVDRVRPGWRLEVQLDRAAGAAGATKIGGDPDLAPGERWPYNKRGIPMTFVAQVDTARLPALDPAWPDPAPWRHDGLLIRVFADLLDNPIEPGPTAIFVSAPGGELTRTPAPDPPDPFPPGGPWDGAGLDERPARLPEALVAPTPFLSAPELHPALKPEVWDFSDAAERYDAWASALRTADQARPDRDAYVVHHLLGEACSIQDDVLDVGPMVAETPSWGALPPGEIEPALTSPDAWRVLLALHFDERIELHIHDGGAFHLIAPVNDLASGRYDRVVCVPESG